ncbi:MAG TPA: hypothetical protein VKS78_09120, partial [Roseiarcus sp.]|nr:hypothetical protein [Roseiarcus sp.]
MLRTILLAGAATLLGATAAMADASNFQPYMFDQGASQAQAQPAASDTTAPNRPERADNKTMRRHTASNASRRMAAATEGTAAGAAVGTENGVGQTWNPPSQSEYYPPNAPQAWGYAPGPSYGAAGYYGPTYASGGYYGSPYYGGGMVEGRAAYVGPSGVGPDYPEIGPPIGQTMQNPPSASMY